MLNSCNNNANYENSNLFINLNNPSIKINNLNSMIANENYNNNNNNNNSLSLKYDLNKEAYAITHKTNANNLMESQYDLKTFQALNKNLNSNDELLCNTNTNIIYSNTFQPIEKKFNPLTTKKNDLITCNNDNTSSSASLLYEINTDAANKKYKRSQQPELVLNNKSNNHVNETFTSKLPPVPRRNSKNNLINNSNSNINLNSNAQTQTNVSLGKDKSSCFTALPILSANNNNHSLMSGQINKSFKNNQNFFQKM